jgi:hypothetical protein
MTKDSFKQKELENILNSEKDTNRRTFLTALGILGAALVLPDSARAELKCANTPYGRTCQTYCDPQVPSIMQRRQNWCWAACIEMVLKYNGCEISQEKIVQETYGGLVNAPAQPITILRQLDRNWTSDDGEIYRVAPRIYNTPQTAAQSLEANKPMIIGTMKHAMVLTELQYTINQYGVRIDRAVVNDPLRGPRDLTSPEWYGLQSQYGGLAVTIDIKSLGSSEDVPIRENRPSSDRNSIRKKNRTRYTPSEDDEDSLEE